MLWYPEGDQKLRMFKSIVWNGMVTSVAMNTEVHISFWTAALSGYMPKTETGRLTDMDNRLEGAKGEGGWGRGGLGAWG